MESTTETNDSRARMDEEVQVLEAIFLRNDFEDLRKKDTWKVWRAPEFKLKLYPSSMDITAEEVYAMVEMHVMLPILYPEQLPLIKFTAAKGVCEADLKLLAAHLDDLAEQLRGQEMLFQLCEAIQEFLCDKNRPPEYQSFYDGMIRHQQQLKSSELDAQQLEEQKLRNMENQDVKQIEVELQRREKLRRQTVQKQKALSSVALCNESTNSDATSTSRSQELIELSRSRSTCFAADIDITSFKRCIRLEHPEKCYAEYLGILGCSLECVTISEWKIELVRKTEGNAKFDLELLKEEIAAMAMLRCSYLLNYLTLQVKLPDAHSVEVILLKENNFSMPVSRFLERSVEIPVSQMRQILHDILTAIDYLHSAGITHDDIRLGCLWESTSGFLLSDFRIYQRLKLLTDFAEKEKFTFDALKCEWNRQEDIESRKLTDIFMFGCCMLDLAKGSSNGKQDLSSVPPSFGEEFKELLAHMIVTRPSSRWSADRLLLHSFFYADTKHRRSIDTAFDGEDEMMYPVIVGNDMPHSLLYKQASKRLETEFEVLKSLGRGGFGDVCKVRNKLDGCVYAIKRVPLNPRNKTLNKKITREVKLLSQLNHENVVRYYNSWIEAAAVPTILPPHDEKDQTQVRFATAEKPIVDDSAFLESLCPVPDTGRSVEWSYSAKANASDANSSDSSEAEAGVDTLFDDISFSLDSTSDSDVVIFERDSNQKDESLSVPVSAEVESEKRDDNEKFIDNVHLVQILYIQMEFCEKSTLKLAIDRKEIFSDSRRAWRLFREILEGLNYIHTQGMIHRDLKPSNIFLDSYDHVKIGDFGLAITGVPDANSAENAQFSPNISVSVQLSTDVGTYLYASPEMQTTAGYTSYSQKVDIYSLGIIFFEMFYPMATAMERVLTLCNLRKENIEMPESFRTSVAKKRHVKLLKMMLNHNPVERPSSEQLLKSNYLPPAEIKQTEFEKNINAAMADSQSRQYKYIVCSAVEQQPSTVQDYLYDVDLYKAPFQADLCVLRQNVERVFVDLFCAHGAMRIDTSLLMPKKRRFVDRAGNRVLLMARSGIVVHLPFALRVPFARFVAKNHITHVKRFSIAKVFKERKTVDTHPREYVECAFDIVTSSTNCATAVAELLSVLSDIVDRFSGLKAMNFCVKINHTGLLKVSETNYFRFCGCLVLLYLWADLVIYHSFDLLLGSAVFRYCELHQICAYRISKIS
ncbi:unnamed protein product [Soboliphyme baturini]|uniref:non-specific serine/threonine protein kinase n=1 Tax=Soboliphyme baturini TaxID=241478 RepID=A0A183ICV9_9BILA|nr:unnamed protein product [Soboliphyme baturini]